MTCRCVPGKKFGGFDEDFRGIGGVTLTGSQGVVRSNPASLIGVISEVGTTAPAIVRLVGRG